MCIMSGWEDPIIFHRVIVDLRGVEGVRNLFNASPPIWLIGQILSGWEDPIIFGSYCGFKRGGGSKESCERFSSYMTYMT